MNRKSLALALAVFAVAAFFSFATSPSNEFSSLDTGREPARALDGNSLSQALAPPSDTAVSEEGSTPRWRSRGRVVDAIDGRPIAGAEVTLLDDDDVRGSAVSGESGAFDVGVEGWVSDARAMAKGYARWEGSIPSPFDDRETIIALDAAVVVHGIAVDEAGNPVSEVEIRVVDVDRSWPVPTSSTAVTAADGRFEIVDAPAGVLEVQAEHARLADGRVALGGTAAGRHHKGVRVVLARTGAVSGVVRDETGRAAADAHVEWRERIHDKGTVEESWTAGEDGRFVLHVPPGDGGVFARKKGAGAGFTPVRVTPGGTTLADVSLGSANEIAGRALDPRGAPVVGATISVLPTERGVATPETITDATGRFRIVVETHEGVFLKARLPFAIGTSNLVWEGATDVVIRVSPVVRVRYRLVDVDGEPYLLDANVEATSRGDRLDRDSDVLLGPPGQWIVSVEPFDSDRPPEKTAITVPSTPPETEVTIRVLGSTAPRGRVTGRVVGPEGHPVTGARISVMIPRSDDRPLGGGGRMEWRGAVHSAADGCFAIEAPAGLQRLFVFHPELLSELPVVTVPENGALDVGDIRLAGGEAASYVVEFTGIGVSSDRDDRGKWVISHVMKGLPAERAGLVQGDVITEIDGTYVEPLEKDDVWDRLQGLPGSVVTLEIEREDAERFSVELVRQTFRRF